MKSIIIPTVLALILIYACEPQGVIPNNDIKKSDTLIVQDTIRVGIRLLNPVLLPNTNIIDDSVEYYKLLNYRFKRDSLYTSLPHIDFNKRTFLGFEVFGGEAYCVRTIYKINSLKEYYFYVEIRDTSRNQISCAYQLWYTIPKIEPDYSVKFNFIHIPLPFEE